jgi:hypothetical protein
MDTHIEITVSGGSGRAGQRFAYVRPARKCFNASRRFRLDKLAEGIAKHFPEVYYFRVDGQYVIGAKDATAALAEYRRVCAVERKNVPVTVEFIE